MSLGWEISRTKFSFHTNVYEAAHYAANLLSAGDEDEAIRVMQNPKLKLTPEQRKAVIEQIKQSEKGPRTLKTIEALKERLIDVLKSGTHDVTKKGDLLAKILSFIPKEDGTQKFFLQIMPQTFLYDVRKEEVEPTKKISIKELKQKSVYCAVLNRSATGELRDPLLAEGENIFTKVFQIFPRLETLNVGDSSTVEEIQQLAPGIQKFCPKFALLDLVGADIRGKFSEVIVPFMPFLKGIRVHGTNSLTPDDIRLLKKCLQLTRLDFLTIANAENLEAVSELTRLTHLDLTGAGNHPGVVNHLPRLHNLKRLETFKTTIYEESIPEEREDETPEQRTRRREQIKNAEHRQIGIQAILDMRQLRVLDLADSNMNDEELLSFATLPKLQEFSIAFCRNITVEGIRVFLREKKDLKTLVIEPHEGSGHMRDLLFLADIYALQREFPHINFRSENGRIYREEPAFIEEAAALSAASSSASSSSSSSASSSSTMRSAAP